MAHLASGNDGHLRGIDAAPAALRWGLGDVGRGGSDLAGGGLPAAVAVGPGARRGAVGAAARRTLAIDASSDLGHFLLGWSLMAQEKADEEALQHLARVSKRYPKANIACAGILERLGRKDQAKISLQSYLDSGETDARAQAEQWLAALN